MGTNHWHHQWRTANEKTYINYLVAGELPDRKMSGTAEERLANYIRSAKRRVRWETFGAVDGKEVIKYAEDILSGL